MIFYVCMLLLLPRTKPLKRNMPIKIHLTLEHLQYTMMSEFNIQDGLQMSL